MSSKYLLCAAAVVFAGVAGCNKRETIHYIGRFTDEPTPRFEWSGSGVVARFDGTGIAVKLGGAANTFESFIDGQPAASIRTSAEPSAKTFTIGEKLPPGTHTVELYRRTEALFNPSTFEGFVVVGGSLRRSRYPFAHRMLFVGDSISAGYGNLADFSTGCHLEVDTESVLAAYPMLTARALNAGAHVLAWSGKGMYRQYNDGETPSADQMPVLFERTLPTEPAPAWSHAKFVPEVIVVNLGANDWSKGDPGQPFVIAYTSFIRHLRELYPKAEIFCTLGPTLTKPQAYQYVEDVVTKLGDAHIHYFPFAHVDPADGVGCDRHPTQATHRKMAEALTAQIRGVMRW